MIFDSKERIKERIMASKKTMTDHGVEIRLHAQAAEYKIPRCHCVCLFHIIRCAVDFSIYCCVFIPVIDLIINFVDLA